jgi:hypothetical protein
MFTVAITRTAQFIEWQDFDTCAEAWSALGKTIEKLAIELAQATVNGDNWPVTTIVMEYGYDSGMPTRYAKITMA